MYSVAVSEGIACHAHGTVAHGNVVHYLTDGAGTTGTWTGIHTLLLLTRPILRTFRAKDTLGTTGDVGITLVLGNACALSLSKADGIAATGTRITGIARFFISRWCYRNG